MAVRHLADQHRHLVVRQQRERHRQTVAQAGGRHGAGCCADRDDISGEPADEIDEVQPRRRPDRPARDGDLPQRCHPRDLVGEHGNRRTRPGAQHRPDGDPCDLRGGREITQDAHRRRLGARQHHAETGIDQHLCRSERGAAGQVDDHDLDPVTHQRGKVEVGAVGPVGRRPGKGFQRLGREQADEQHPRIREQRLQERSGAVGDQSHGDRRKPHRLRVETARISPDGPQVLAPRRRSGCVGAGSSD